MVGDGVQFGGVLCSSAGRVGFLTTNNETLAMSNKLFNNMNRVSRLFQPITIIPKDAKVKADNTSKSYKVCFADLYSSATTFL